MAYHLSGKEHCLDVSNSGWPDVLQLARRFGWRPAGPLPRGRRKGKRRLKETVAAVGPYEVDRVFDYCGNGVVVAADDAAAFADALEAAFAILKARDPSENDSIAARARVRMCPGVNDAAYARVSTEDLIDMFGHQKQLLEWAIGIAREGEFSIW